MNLASALRRALPGAVILALLAGGFVAVSARCGGTPAPLRSDLPVIVLESPGAPDWVRLERASGVSARTGTLDQLLARTAGIIPDDAQLTSADHTMIHRWVERGGRLVTAHRDLLAGLGVSRAQPVTIADAPIPGTTLTARWSAPMQVAGLLKGKGLTSLTPIIEQQGVTLVGEAKLGDGFVFALAFDPLAGGWAGYEFFPSVGRDVAAWTHAPQGPQRIGAEIYFDPGSLPDDLKKHPELVAERLSGVRAVQIAGWDFGFRDPTNDFDYAALITALHARGILAYAWLEPPMVNLLMWEDHPECREKTATGRDALVDWRSLIALEDPRCLDLAWAQWEPFLKRFDWDGVNLAEMYFEPDIKQDNYTPFHPSALKLFGQDPAREPERFKDFRKDLVVTLNEELLTRLNSLPRAKEMDFELTVIDDRLDPVHGRSVGSDVTRLAEVAKRGGASLQVEDPFTTWTEGPLRYDRLVPAVVPLLAPGQVFLDVNVVPREDTTPTDTMTGAEFDLAAMSAGRAGGRLGVFSVATLGPNDLAHLPGALAGSAESLDTGVRASTAVTVFAPKGSGDTQLDVDGVPWPSAAGSAVIPKGEHRLAWAAGASRGPALLRITGELGSASVESDALTLAYDSRGRGYAVVDRKPVALAIDGSEARLDTVVNPGGGFTVTLPQGTHTATIATQPLPANTPSN